MSARSLLLVFAGMLTLAGQAAPPPVAPETLPAAMSRQVEDVIALKKKTDDAAAALRKWYEASLDAMKKTALAKGDLDAVLASDTERGRIDRDLTDQEKAALPPASLAVRNQFDQAHAAQAAQEKAAYAALLRGYVATLEALEKRLTQKADIDAALATRKERAKAGEQLAAVAPPPEPIAVAKASPPPPAAPPATPTVPVKKPGSALGAVPAVPVLEVTSTINGLSYVVSPLKNVSAFWAPQGPRDANGGRGVYLKNEPATGRSGTTWSFSISRRPPDGGGVMVHPLGNGHIAVQLREQGLFVLSPKDFVTSMREGGDATKIKLTDAGKALFPLGSKEYQVVSQLTGSGRYTISINGEVAGTATFTTGEPVAFSKLFKGEQGAIVPTGRLSVGSAVLICGGAEKGGACGIKAVTFQASAPEPAR